MQCIHKLRNTSENSRRKLNDGMSISESRFEIQNEIIDGILNPFLTNVPLLYPLKISENRVSSYAFRGYRGVTLVENWLISIKVERILKYHATYPSVDDFMSITHLRICPLYVAPC